MNPDGHRSPEGRFTEGPLWHPLVPLSEAGGSGRSTTATVSSNPYRTIRATGWAPKDAVELVDTASPARGADQRRLTLTRDVVSESEDVRALWQTWMHG